MSLVHMYLSFSATTPSQSEIFSVIVFNKASIVFTFLELRLDMSDVCGVLGNSSPRSIQLFSCLAECLLSLILGFLGDVGLLQGDFLLC